MKSIIFVSLLVAAIAIPLAEAQITLPVSNLLNITGTVFCPVNASVIGTDPFTNATVKLQCSGLLGNLTSTTTTTVTGAFSIVSNNTITLNPNSSEFVRDCGVAVTTPLVNCNANLAALSGILTSTLTPVSSGLTRLTFLAITFRLQF